MDVVNTNPTSLASLVSIVNSKVESKLLTDNNFEILSIKPLTLTTSKHNTVAEIRVDLGASLPIKALTANDRYSLRTVEFTRIDLKDIAKFRNLTVNEKGQYVADVTDLAGVIELLGANIAEDELTLIPLKDAFVVKAASDSLGYIGSITLTGTLSEVEPTPGLPRLNVTALGRSLILTESNPTPHVTEDFSYTDVYNEEAQTLNITVDGIWDENVIGSHVSVPVVFGDANFAKLITAISTEKPTQLALSMNGQQLPAAAFGQMLKLSDDGRYTTHLDLSFDLDQYEIALSLDGFQTSTTTTINIVRNYEVIPHNSKLLQAATIRPFESVGGDIGDTFTVICDFDDLNKLMLDHKWEIAPAEYFELVESNITDFDMTAKYRVVKELPSDTAVTVTNTFNTSYTATQAFTALAAGTPRSFKISGIPEVVSVDDKIYFERIYIPSVLKEGATEVWTGTPEENVTYLQQDGSFWDATVAGEVTITVVTTLADGTTLQDTRVVNVQPQS